MSTIKSSAENLTLNADGSGNDIKFQSNGSEVASISDGGVVTATSFAGSGASLTGITSVGGATGVDFNDNVKARFGTGNDLEIYHDGSNSYIDDTGTGNLLIKGQNLKLLGSNNDDIVFGQQGGAVTLYHSNAAKLATTATGVTVTGAIAGATNLGKVLQVVRDNNNGDTYIGGSHSSYTDTGLTVTLTTAGANSKFIISVGTGMHYTSGQDSYTNIRRNISGGANTSDIVPGTYGLFHERATGWTNGSGEFVDYPSIAASTSVTYTVQIKNSGSVDWCHSAGYCYITVTEVAA